MKSVTNLNVDVLIPEDDRLTHPILAPIQKIKKKITNNFFNGKDQLRNRNVRRIELKKKSPLLVNQMLNQKRTQRSKLNVISPFYIFK